MKSYSIYRRQMQRFIMKNKKKYVRKRCYALKNEIWEQSKIFENLSTLLSGTKILERLRDVAFGILVIENYFFNYHFLTPHDFLFSTVDLVLWASSTKLYVFGPFVSICIAKKCWLLKRQDSKLYTIFSV